MLQQNYPLYSSITFPSNPVNGQLFFDVVSGFNFRYSSTGAIYDFVSKVWRFTGSWEIRYYTYSAGAREPTNVTSEFYQSIYQPDLVNPTPSTLRFKLNPVSSVYGGTTIFVPMANLANKTQQLNAYDTYDQWMYIDDYRAANYWYKSTGAKVTFLLGQYPDTNTMTNVAPPYDLSLGYRVFNNGNNTWGYDLDKTRLFQKNKISRDSAANLQSLLTPGVDTIYDISAYAMAEPDALHYEEIIPDPLDYTFTTNVALSGTAPLIQDGNDLTGVTAATCKLTGQTTATQNSYYNYAESGGNYTLTEIAIPNVPFYDGVAYQSGGSIMEAHENWGNPSNGGAQYFGIFAEKKRLLIAAIDAASTGPDILALNWISM